MKLILNQSNIMSENDKTFIGAVFMVLWVVTILIMAAFPPFTIIAVPILVLLYIVGWFVDREIK